MGEESVQVTVDRMRGPDDAVKGENKQRDGEHEAEHYSNLLLAVGVSLACTVTYHIVAIK